VEWASVVCSVVVPIPAQRPCRYSSDHIAKQVVLPSPPAPEKVAEHVEDDAHGLLMIGRADTLAEDPHLVSDFDAIEFAAPMPLCQVTEGSGEGDIV
jgi:hypothetical protein